MQFEQNYAESAHLASARLLGLVRNLAPVPRWIGTEDRFWLRIEQASGHSYVLVDAATGTQRPAFDHDALARYLNAQGGLTVTANTLPITRLSFEADNCVAYTATGSYLLSQGDDSETLIENRELADAAWKRSPSTRAVLELRNNNLWIYKDSDEAVPLTSDGEADFAYGDVRFLSTSRIPGERQGEGSPPGGIHWSDCGRFVLALRLDRRALPVNASGVDFTGGQDRRARAIRDRVPLAGDSCPPEYVLTIVNFESGDVYDAQLGSEYLSDYAVPHFVYGAYFQRGTMLYMITADFCGSSYGLSEINLLDGTRRTIIRETEDAHFVFNPFDYNRPNVHVMADGATALWYSQRSGSGHLYQYDLASGEILGALTEGDWTVADLLHVDEQGGWVYFTACGVEPSENPYFRKLYRVALAGGAPQLLTPENADHQFDNILLPEMPDAACASISPSGNYFVDCFSTVEAPPVSVLRRADGTTIAEICRCDISDLEAQPGWLRPTPIDTLADDGATRLYGVMYTPPQMDRTKRYPVIDCTYPGPQGPAAPTTFAEGIVCAAVQNPHVLANMGFIVLAFDGRGCGRRNREFQYAHIKNEDVLGAIDHVAGIKHLAQRHDFIDLTRVGISGSSFGGYGALRAQLLYPEFFKACVSCCGPSDYRYMPSSVSIERFFRHSEDNSEADRWYETVSNLRLIDRLQGKLLLVHGEIDENVPLQQHFLLLKALQRAGKSHETLLLADCAHVVSMHPFAICRIARFFYEHLEGES